jgi:hypothetical protein
MARITDDSKHARKERVWLCVKRNPRGITEINSSLHKMTLPDVALFATREHYSKTGHKTL